MPKASNQLALSRQWEILRRLPARSPGITAAELTDYLRNELGYAASKRTVERDLVNLSRVFGIRCNDRAMPFGWYWLAGVPRDLGGMDLADAVSLVLAEQMLAQLLPASLRTALAPRFALARNKLAELQSKQRLAAWTEKVRSVPATLNFLAPKVNSSALARAQEAVLHERQLRVVYAGPQQAKATELVLHPLGLVQRGLVLYLVGTAFDYEDVRLYAVHRIRSAEMLDDRLKKPDGFSIDRYLATDAMQFGGGRKIRMRVLVGEDLAVHLAETPLSEDQSMKPTRDGHVLSATVADSWTLRWWILGQSDSVTVISPKRLREEIVAILSASLARYASRDRARA